MSTKSAALAWDGYFINLDRSVDRRKHMALQLDAAGLSQYRRFPAIDGRLRKAPFIRKPGELGIYQSHSSLLRTAAAGDRPIHVLEDDVVLSDLAASAIALVIGNHVLDQFDLVVLETYIGHDIQNVRGWTQLLSKAKTEAWPVVTAEQLQILDITQIYLFGTTSYLAGPTGAKRVVSILDEEWRRGPTIPVDTVIQKAARAGRLRVGCVFPFVTSLDLVLSMASEAGRNETENDVLVQRLLRYSFYVKADIDGLALPTLSRLIHEKLGTPDSTALFHSQVLQYYLRRR